MNPNRPNTTVSDSALSPDILLCCGEDAGEILAAINKMYPAIVPILTHAYRCYKFWNCGNFTLIWTGIGTGCLEPLMYEILEVPLIKRIVLVGTAGATAKGQESLQKGDAYVITSAHIFAAGVCPTNINPYQPRWKSSVPLEPCASTISSDYYYGFSLRDDPRTKELRLRDSRLKDEVVGALDRAELVDMETGQFYHFCEALADKSLQYIAVRGPANIVGKFEEQTAFSSSVLERSIEKGCVLMGKTH